MNIKIETLIAYVVARLSERSSWEGIAFLLTLTGSRYGANLPLDQCVALGGMLSGAIKIIFPDIKQQKDPS
jgi:hypothetical protein